MRIAALIIGILGALAGAIGAVIAITVGGIGVGLGDVTNDVTTSEEGKEIIWLGVSALIASFVGLVAAALAIGKPKFSALFMLLAAIAGMICVSWAYVIGGPMLLVASILAFLGRNEGRGQGGNPPASP